MFFFIVDDRTLSEERKAGAAGNNAPQYGDNSPSRGEFDQFVTGY